MFSKIIKHDEWKLGCIKDRVAGVGKLAVAVALVSLLTACAAPIWVKPNATTADLEQAKADCGIEAANRVPIHMVQSIQEGSASSTESCDKHGRNCSTYSTFTPPSVVAHDSNASLRNQAFRACLFRNGWSEVKP